MSGSTVGGVVGAVIGSFIPGVGTSIGWMVGSAIGGYVDPEVIKGPRMHDAQVQTSREGEARPIVYGTTVVAGNVIQTGPLVEHKHKDRVGKGGGQVQETYTYSRSYAIRICEGPITGILRVWRDDKLVYDARNPDTPQDGVEPSLWAKLIQAMRGDSASFLSKATFYLGDETQLPDPTLEALPEAYGGGAGNVPAYRGSAYVVFRDDDLTERQGTIPQYRFEVTSCGTSADFAGDSVGGIYAFPGNGPSLLHSSDGVTWDYIAVPADITYNAYMYVGGGRVFLLDPSGVGYVTEDGGGHWLSVSGLHAATVETMTCVGSSQYVLFYNGTTDGIQTSGGGRVFTDALTTSSVYYSSATDGGTVLLGGAAGIMRRSTDGGGTFGASYTALVGSNGINYLVHAQGNFVAFRVTEINYSPDGTLGSWVSATNPGTPWTQFGGVAVGPNGIVAMSQEGTVIYSGDGGQTWTQRTSVPIGSTGTGGTENLAYDPVNEIFVATGQLQGIYTSADYGQTWTAATTATGTRTIEHVGAMTLPVNLSTVPDMPDFAVDSAGNLYGPGYTAVTPCGDVTVAEIVADLCDRVGIPSTALDVTQLTDIVRGVAIGRQMSASDAIRSMQQGYFFDFPEWDHKLRGIKRGGPTLYDITDDDLVWSDDDQDTRAQAVEFPRKINLVSPDPSRNYEPLKETATRRTDNIKAVGEATVELPMSQIAAERARTAEKMLKIAWAEAEGRTEFQLPENFTGLTPSDPFTKSGKRWRADKVELGDGIVKVEAVRDRASAYTSTLAGTTPGHTGSTPGNGLYGPTLFTVTNAPSLRTSDNVPGVYIGARGILPGWVGADIQLSTDGGLTYTTVTRLTIPAALGQLSQAATSGSTSLYVEMQKNALESVTASQITAGLNRAAIISSGVAEILQFRTADETSTHFYTLTTLTRGQLGSSAASHSVGDIFALTQTLTFLPLNADLAGQTLYFRAVSIGTAAENNPVQTIVFNPPSYIIDGGSA